MARYLMEHPLEAERLELKTREERILQELNHLSIRPGMDVVDVGCGTGAVTRILARVVAPGRVVGVDRSADRLAAAREAAQREGLENVEYVQCDVEDLRVPGGPFDLAFSRCLFQYLPREAGHRTLEGMKRLVRRGGNVCVADIDGNHLYRYPTDEEWEGLLNQLLKSVEHIGFDAYIGRKLFSMFLAAGLRDVRVDILPYYLIAGKADPTTYRVWEMKAKILEETLISTLGTAERFRELSTRFLGDLLREDVLLYSLLFLVQGKA